MAKKKTERKVVTLSTRLSAVECSQDAVVGAVTTGDVMMVRVIERLRKAEGDARLHEDNLARVEARITRLAERLTDVEERVPIPKSDLAEVVVDLRIERLEGQVERLINMAARTWWKRLSAWCKQAWAGLPEEAQ